MARKWAVLVVAVVLLACGALALLSPAPLTRDEPRSLPFELADYRSAKSGWDIDDEGRIHAWVEHLFLTDVTPAMVSWFYRHLPISTLRYRGTQYPLYHFFHPTEHGRLRVVEPATDGTVGMGLGALIEREEWFDEFDSKGAARIVEYSDAGFLAIPQALGLTIGEVRHQFYPENGGTRYRVDTIIGSRLPLVGPALNWYLRTQVFHPQMLAQWQRHQIEEVSTIVYLVPQIYPQRGEGVRDFVWLENN